MLRVLLIRTPPHDEGTEDLAEDSVVHPDHAHVEDAAVLAAHGLDAKQHRHQHQHQRRWSDQWTDSDNARSDTSLAYSHGAKEPTNPQKPSPKI